MFNKHVPSNEVVLVTLKKVVERVFNFITVTKRIFQLCFLSRDGDVKYYSLFSVLYERFVRDDLP